MNVLLFSKPISFHIGIKKIYRKKSSKKVRLYLGGQMWNILEMIFVKTMDVYNFLRYVFKNLLKII